MKVEPRRAVRFSKNLSILKFMGGNLISLFGDRIYLIALPWLVFNLTGSTVAMGIVAAVERLPNLLQPFMGALADRLDRKRIMLFCDAARCLLLCTIGTLDVYGRLRMGELYAGALFLGLLSQFYQTSQFAFVPSLVRRNERHLVNSFNSGMFHTRCRICGTCNRRAYHWPLWTGVGGYSERSFFFGKLLGDCFHFFSEAGMLTSIFFRRCQRRFSVCHSKSCVASYKHSTLVFRFWDNPVSDLNDLLLS